MNIQIHLQYILDNFNEFFWPEFYLDQEEVHMGLRFEVQLAFRYDETKKKYVLERTVSRNDEFIPLSHKEYSDGLKEYNLIKQLIDTIKAKQIDRLFKEDQAYRSHELIRKSTEFINSNFDF